MGLFHVVEALCLEHNDLFVTRNQIRTRAFFHIANDRQVRIGLDFVVIGDRNSEEQFVILTPIQSHRGRIQVEFFTNGIDRRINWNFILVYIHLHF